MKASKLRWSIQTWFLFLFFFGWDVLTSEVIYMYLATSNFDNICTNHLLNCNHFMLPFRCSSQEAWEWSSWYFSCCGGWNSRTGYKCTVLHIICFGFHKIIFFNLASLSHWITITPGSVKKGLKGIHMPLQHDVQELGCFLFRMII